MKFLLVLFLVGFASASLYDVLDQAADEIVKDFIEGVELSNSIKTYMAMAEGDDETEKEENIKTELGKKLREHLDELLEKVRDAINHGKGVKEDIKKQIEETLKKLKDMKIDIGEKAKELFQNIKEKLKDYLQKILEKLGLKDKIEDDVRASTNWRESLKQLKEEILEKFDVEKIKAKIEEIFGRKSKLFDQMWETLKEKKEKAKEKILAFIDRLLGKEEKEDRETRSLKDLWEKVKNYFDELHIDLKEKYLKFGEWVKEFVGDRLEKGKSKLENLKQIARELIDHAKVLKKEVVVETLEFFRPYKEDLGTLWDDLKNKMQEVLNKKDN